MTADDRGKVATRVAIPFDTKAGDHTLNLSGSRPKGGARTVEIPFRVAGGGTPALVAAILFGGLAGGVVFALLLVALLIAGLREGAATGRGGAP